MPVTRRNSKQERTDERLHRDPLLSGLIFAPLQQSDFRIPCGRLRPTASDCSSLPSSSWQTGPQIDARGAQIIARKVTAGCRLSKNAGAFRRGSHDLAVGGRTTIPSRRERVGRKPKASGIPVGSVGGGHMDVLADKRAQSCDKRVTVT